MVSTTVKVISSEGLTGDVVNQLTNELAKYDFDITLAYNGTKTTANSSLGVMSLGVPSGAKIDLSVDGTTEQLKSVVSSLVDQQLVTRI
ncbi:HPr family phosphocarrier protein [Secundilactobacillus hailunensis]|uniref:HPr family phosphocarrier protein n=1 Tax=Secundilactobacillus hailunensis TaxID=2559923 RepID=A0ABW1T761_9LACO|nr:HPr family phosphocarrier protein [Secundilactobacillus hailunensis]